MKFMLGTIDTSDKDLTYYTITSLNGVIYCRKCNAIFTFEEDDIDRNKSLPHIDCLKCKRPIQLPAKYRKPNWTRFTREV